MTATRVPVTVQYVLLALTWGASFLFIKIGLEGLSPGQVVLGRMVDALGDGGRVELRGFGAFSVRGRPARAGRNPRTGESVEVPAKAVPFFKSGKELRERLNAD